MILYLDMHLQFQHNYSENFVCIRVGTMIAHNNLVLIQCSHKKLKSIDDTNKNSKWNIGLMKLQKCFNYDPLIKHFKLWSLNKQFIGLLDSPKTL